MAVCIGMSFVSFRWSWFRFAVVRGGCRGPLSEIGTHSWETGRVRCFVFNIPRNDQSESPTRARSDPYVAIYLP
jgi:hypothetical protein